MEFEMNYTTVIYIGFIVMYLELFMYLFNEKIDLILLIFMFVLYLLSGLKIITDVKSKSSTLSIPFDLPKFIEFFKKFSLPIGIVGTVLIITYTILAIWYKTATTYISTIIFGCICVGVSGFLVGFKSKDVSEQKFELWAIATVPVSLIAMSLLFIIIAGTHLVNKSGDDISLELSATNRTILSTYKIGFIINVIASIALLTYLLNNADPKNNNQPVTVVGDLKSYAGISFIYVTSSVLLYLSTISLQIYTNKQILA